MGITGNKILFNLENVLAGKPITADIFLNDYCNNRCPYCTYARYGDRNGEYMSFELFKDVVYRLQAQGVKGFILTGGGEPTISKDFDQITTWLEARRIPYGINTNFNVYKEIRPAYLKVSLDAWDEVSYIKKRGVDAYATVLTNLWHYLNWKQREGVQTPVGIQLVAETPEEVFKFYEAHKKMPVDYFNLRPMESTGCSYYRDHDWLPVLEAIRELKKEDPRVTVNYKWEHLFESFDKCYAHNLQVAVNQRGELMYCCHKPYEIIGSIKDPDIWKKYRKAHTNMKMCDIPCRLTGPNEFLATIQAGCSNSEFI